MTKSSIRLIIATIAMIFTFLSILMPVSASAASYKKCYKGWAFGYDKNANAAGVKAIAAWDAKAQTFLATSAAKWVRATNRQKHIKKVYHNGEPTNKASIYGKYCKNNAPSAKRNSPAGRGPRLPMVRRR